MVRRLYTDSYNSAAHLGLGVIAGYTLNPLLISVYLSYQLVQGGQNTGIDIIEFIIPLSLVALNRKKTE